MDQDLSAICPAITNASHRLLYLVPEEIWVQIFLESFEENEGLLSKWNPFVLSAVCAYWRRIALTNTVLWDTVSIRFFSIVINASKFCHAINTVKMFQARVDALKVWIGRAGTRPLSIKLEGTCLNGESEVIQQIPRIIVAHASRIVSLDMHIYHEWRAFFQGVEFPQLRALKLGEPSIWTSPMCEPLDFTRSSHLSVLKIHKNFKTVGVVLPWSQITDVDLGSIHPGDCFNVLDLLPNLKRCTLDLGGLLDDAERRESPSLIALDIKAAGPGIIQKLLDSLPLTLQDLSLCVPPTRASHSNFEFLLKSVSPFARTLRSLLLSFTPPDSITFPDFLALLPALEKLELRVFQCQKGFDEHFFLRCFATVGVLPRLSSLTFKGFGDELADETIMTILRYRRHIDGDKDCVKIKDARFQFLSSWRNTPHWDRAPLHPASKTELNDMIKDGLNVSITFSPTWAGPETSLLL